MNKLLAVVVMLFATNVNAGIIRQNVRTLSNQGDTPLNGDVTLSAGTNVTIVQTGQDIQISSTGGSSGSASSSNIKFTLNDAVIPYTNIDGPHYQAITATVSSVNISMLNAGDSGFTSMQINQYRGGSYLGSSTVTVTANAGSSTATACSVSPALSLIPGDMVTVDITQTAIGTPEALTLEY